MWSRIAQSRGGKSESNEEKWTKLTDGKSESWDIDHVRSAIIDAEDKLHLQEVWRRIGKVWTFVGNVALVALAGSAALSGIDQIARFSLLIYAVCATSLLASPVLIYRQYKRTRATRIMIKKLHVLRRRILSDMDDSSDGQTDSALPAQKRYRDDIPDLISQFREDASSTRRIHNRLQSVIIVGSVVTSAIATASVSYGAARWVTVGASTLVGLAAGFMGYYKYHERSFNSQQTADAIEREYEAVELRVGSYTDLDEKKAYALFAANVERLRDEQNKRQQQLDQPVEVKREE
ncbi:DUF4231 domain-containing protein [Micromonospora gifhornensis]|uniref:SMODS and SLOG-associating 2TM effector domain-containing protein n=1 Tax=Micromonospora gifhornensis TaxID=84594 RepID=A0ABQ4IL83_9ACTN|nr:DUF4231 domain-containing protein [Micromonospora gifhornensis]GIJ18671.1 hypothetical protein Vgi01_53550 [Micromonospora gifhornensis]